MRQADLTFVIFTITVVGVVDVDTENTWTTLISKYDRALTTWKSIIDGAMGGKITFFHKNCDFMAVASSITLKSS